jgi:hypothetical protein
MPEKSTPKDLSKLKEEFALVQRGLELIKLIDEAEKDNNTADQETANHEVTHPVGAEVKFTNPNEKYELRGKTAEVIGHSPKFVRVRRGRDTYRRHSSNLTPRK